MRVTAVLLVLATTAPVWADQRSDLQARGEQLAKDGRFDAAIATFKEADRLEPRASHACLIALAYTRRERWSQAELFLALCYQRVNAGDPLPMWAPRAKQLIDERLAAAAVAAVTIEVTPRDAATQLALSSFEPDEVFAPRTLHLAPGSYVVVARAPGFPDARRAFEVKDTTAQRIVIELAPAGPATPPARPVPAPAVTKRGTWLLVAGGAAVVTGAAAHGWMAYERGHLVDAQATRDVDRYADHATRFDVARIASIGLYAAGAALLVTGMVLRGRSPEPAASVSAVPLAGGGLVVVEWRP